MTGEETRAISHGKRGPKPSQHRALLREWMDHMSDRTFATYYNAHCILLELGDEAQHRAAITASTRPNGSFNVSKYERLAYAALIQRMDEAS